MKRFLASVFQVGFLFVYILSFVFPVQGVNAAVKSSENSISASLEPVLPPLEELSDTVSLPNTNAAPGPNPASGGSTIVSATDFAPGKSSAEISAELGLLGYSTPSYATTRTSGGLSITPITAYNLIVDSNVLSPSSYGPSAATLGAQYCNTSGSTMNNVWAYVGNFNGDNDATLDEAGDYTPGYFPVRDENAGSYDPAAFSAQYGALSTNNLLNATATDYGLTSNAFALKFEGGSLGVSDASRYLGTLAAGECRTQYWTISYPRKALIGGNWVDVTGGVKPEDDLWLPYFFWGTSNTTGSTPSYVWRPVTMRNEISAMANKIWPNGDNKVPAEYVAAIQQVTGWSTWTPSGSSVAYPGQTVTSQGIWYDFGNVGAGFDNNGDFTPDRNAWVQPIGDVGAYDPGCFRLVKTYGLVIVKLNDGTEMLIPFVDQMYFENIPANNTGAVGLVYYQYVALDGACTAGLTPYQEVASGYDNEKFNADFGAGVPPLQSQETNLTLDKTGTASVAPNSTVNYSLQFGFPESTSASMVVSVGSPSTGSPLVIEDTIPSGMSFLGPVSPTVTMTNYSVASLTATLLYSTDSGTTWSATAPANGTVSTSPNNLIKIQWWLPEAITQKTQGGGTVYGSVSFSATSPNTVTPPPTVTNTGCLKIGNGAEFVCDSFTTLITGSYSLSGTVFCDDGTQTSSSGPCNTGTAASTLANGILDAGGGEPGMPNVSVYLYYDSNGNSSLDATDLLVNNTTVTDSSGNYSFTNLSNGTYFTKVIKTDSDVQSTYGITTPETRTGVIANANVSGLNFGFAPPLTVSKNLTTYGTINIGQLITYSIILRNNLQGGSGTGNSCTFTIWGSKYVLDTSANPPGGNGANQQFQNASGVTGNPDGNNAYTNLANADNRLGIKGFNVDPATLPGTITKVEYLVKTDERLNLKSDAAVTITTYYNGNGTGLGNATTYGNTSASTALTGSAFFTGSAGTAYDLVADITSLKSWSTTDFQYDNTGLQILVAKGTGSDSGALNVDAAALRVTTNQPCPNTPSTTLDPVPLTDAFPTAYMDFVSSVPPVSTVDETGGLLSWNNVGPIPAGSYKEVKVTFRATAQTPAAQTNTATSTTPKFATGADANSASATAQTSISATVANGSISGEIFDDNDLDGWTFGAVCTAGSGSTCALDTGDTAMQAVRVNLLACVRLTGALETGSSSNKDCAAETSGNTWQILQTTYTNASGFYSFTGLAQGIYRVVVDTTTIPGSSQTADPTVTSPAVCVGVNCDHQSYAENTNTNGFTTLGRITGSNSITNVNFGYNAPNTAYGLGDEVYLDWDGDGIRDPGDEIIPNVTVRLFDAGGTQISTSTTNPALANPYSFTRVNGIYTVRVDTATFPAGMALTQTGDPDQAAATCTTCDNASTITINGANNYTRDFGYQPSGSAVLGDTVWKDMNGDGVKSGTQETGIANVTVNLLVDFDGNGTWVVAKTTTTDANGNYSFTNLPDGTYRVQVDTTDTDIPDDAFGNNYVPTNGSLYTSITISSGAVTSMTNSTSGVTSTTANGFGDSVENDPLNLDADFGFAPLASIGDTIYWDSNANGTQDTGEPGINGVTVNLYTFTDAPDGAYTSGEAFTDSNGNGRWDSGETFTDTLGNGRYDPGETLSGSPVATTVTAVSNGQSGKYLFTGLDTDKNGVGYVVVVDTTSAPIASSILNADPSADGVPTNCPAINTAQANCDARDGMKLYPGSNYVGADFGFLPLGSFGDTVWIDTNNNGVLDTGEYGIPNITVTATTSNNITVNGLTYVTGTTLTTSTDANGNYFFQNIIANGSPATWTVTVNTGDIDFPAGLVQTYDPDGTLSNSTTVIVSTTGVVTTVGGCTTTPNGCDGETDALNLDADFGYDYSGSGALSGTVCLDSGYTNAASNTTSDNVGVCGTDRNDTSGVGTGESAYDNVTVYLYRWIDADNDSVIDSGETTQIAVTNTNASGDFSFTNIPDSGGVYYVVAIGAPQSGMELTTQTNDSPTVGDNAKEVVVESNPTVAGVDYTDVSAYQVVLVPTAGNVTNVDFAFAPAGSYDYGDLPDTYATTLEGTPDGPRHLVPSTPTLYLGTAGATQASLVDTNGQPTTDASGDGADDADGITFAYDTNDTDWTNGVQLQINASVVASDVSGTDAYLVGWMDFNHDGDFADSGEMVISSGVNNGPTNLFTVNVPAGTFPHTSGTINSRFRLFANNETPAFPTLAYSGVASSGEVEDYQNKWDMTIDKDTSTPNVIPGGTATYTIVIRNTGNQTLSNVQFLDTLPGSGQAWAWTYTAPISHTESGVGTNFTSDECYDGNLAGGELDLDSNFNTVTCAKWNIGSGGSVTITLTVNVPATTPAATYDNTATASSAQTGTIDDDGQVANDPGTPTSPSTDPEDDEDVTVGSLGTISDYIWDDVNGDGLQTGESGIDNVRVYIDSNNNNSYDVGEPSATTAGGGLYAISGLPAGTYNVRVDTTTLPAGYNPTADLDGGNDHEASVTLTAGQTRTDVDFGYLPPAEIQIVKSVSASVISSGTSVTYSYLVNNIGSVTLTNIAVSDDKCAPVNYLSGDTNNNNALETTETWSYSCTTTLTATTTNIVTVTGSDPINNPVQDTDSATVTVVTSGLTKTMVSTDTGIIPDFTTGTNVAIGEILTYQVTIDLPAGLPFNNVVVTDRMDKGLAFVDCESVILDGVDITNVVCAAPAQPVVSSITDPGDPANNPANPGRQVQFTIGNINAPVTNTTLVIRYRAIVLDVIENQGALPPVPTLNNNVEWAWTGGSISASAPPVSIVEPDISIDKDATPTSGVAVGDPIIFTLTIAHTAQSTADAFDVEVTDILPAELAYIQCSMAYISGPAPSIPANDPSFCTVGGNTTNLLFRWDTIPLGSAPSVIQFSARLVTSPATNSANVAWTSLPIDPAVPGGPPIQLSVHNVESTERWYDPLSTVNIYAVSDSVTINPTGGGGGGAGGGGGGSATSNDPVVLPSLLPATGFAPNRVTVLPEQPEELAYRDTSVWLEVPRLGLKMPIVGVPLYKDDWDISWLWKEAGWLEGTAFPTWQGNSVLTSHVTLPNGEAGPFASLGKLQWGDRVLVHAYGTVYIYEVRANRVISPNDTSVLKHEDDAWLTLLTCKTYIESTNTYSDRIAVRAVLIGTQAEKTTGGKNVR